MRSNPVDQALKNIERMVDRDPVLRDILHPSLPIGTRRPRFVPPVDVIETSDGWMLLMELPGVPRDTLGVRLDGARLIVKGDKPTHHEGKLQTGDRETGPFTREFLIPFQVDGSKIVAKLEDGLLRVTLPRSSAVDGLDVTVR